jgi:hypothetical protein
MAPQWVHFNSDKTNDPESRRELALLIRLGLIEKGKLDHRDAADCVQGLHTSGTAVGMLSLVQLHIINRRTIQETKNARQNGHDRRRVSPCLES